jgi:hypothetical protein
VTKERDETLIAEDLADQLVAGVLSTSKAPSLAAFAHAFGAACEKHQFLPDEAALDRILIGVVDNLGERQRAANELNAAIVRSTADLLDMRRKARAGHLGDITWR